MAKPKSSIAQRRNYGSVLHTVGGTKLFVQTNKTVGTPSREIVARSFPHSATCDINSWGEVGPIIPPGTQYEANLDIDFSFGEDLNDGFPPPGPIPNCVPVGSWPALGQVEIEVDVTDESLLDVTLGSLHVQYYYIINETLGGAKVPIGNPQVLNFYGGGISGLLKQIDFGTIPSNPSNVVTILMEWYVLPHPDFVNNLTVNYEWNTIYTAGWGVIICPTSADPQITILDPDFGEVSLSPTDTYQINMPSEQNLGDPFWETDAYIMVRGIRFDSLQYDATRTIVGIGVEPVNPGGILDAVRRSGTTDQWVDSEDATDTSTLPEPVTTVGEVKNYDFVFRMPKTTLVGYYVQRFRLWFYLSDGEIVISNISWLHGRSLAIPTKIDMYPEENPSSDPQVPYLLMGPRYLGINLVRMLVVEWLVLSVDNTFIQDLALVFVDMAYDRVVNYLFQENVPLINFFDLYPELDAGISPTYYYGDDVDDENNYPAAGTQTQVNRQISFPGISINGLISFYDQVFGAVEAAYSLDIGDDFLNNFNVPTLPVLTLSRPTLVKALSGQSIEQRIYYERELAVSGNIVTTENNKGMRQLTVERNDAKLDELMLTFVNLSNAVKDPKKFEKWINLFKERDERRALKLTKRPSLDMTKFNALKSQATKENAK
jgi:hypothetical protein